MDATKLNAAYQTSVVEVLVAKTPEEMDGRYQELHDIDLENVGELAEKIFKDALRWVSESPLYQEEIAQGPGPAEQIGIACLGAAVLVGQQMFLAGYFYGKESDGSDGD